jgi:peptidoglycan/LPS O-acetylase OafA/YrhL
LYYIYHLMKLQQEKTNSTISHKLHGLDHLRTLAIAFVFIFHYGNIFQSPPWVTFIGKFGWTGVDLFFVLSGYLIASQLFEKIARTSHISLRSFFIKRFFRIIPAYLAVVAIYFCIPYSREKGVPAPLWKYLTFTQNIGLDLSTQGAFSHAWSLCIEEQFYLLLPFTLAAFLFFKIFSKGFWLLIILFIAGFAIRFFLYQHYIKQNPEEGNIAFLWHTIIYYPTWCRLDGLLTGIAIAALLTFKPHWEDKISKYGNLIFLLSLVILAISFYICYDEESFVASVYGFPVVSIGYGVMVLAVVTPSCFLYKFNSKITATIATLSYAIYLIHKILIHITQVEFSKFGMAADSNGMFVLCIIISIIGAWLINKMIEKPFLKLRRKILGKAQAA